MQEDDKIYAPVDIPETITPAMLDAALSRADFFTVTSRSNDLSHWRVTYYFKEKVGNAYGIQLDMQIHPRHILHNTTATASNQPVLQTVNTFGTLSIKVWKSQQNTRSAVAQQRFEFLKTITVTLRQLLQHVDQTECMFYKFAQEESRAGGVDKSGCLYWQLQFLEGLGKKGWIPENASDTARKELEEQSVDKKSPIYRKVKVDPIPKGTFYIQDRPRKTGGSWITQFTDLRF